MLTRPGEEKQNSRLVSLDVYRGITVAAMILVTNPGTYSAIYPPFRHAEWMGATLTDMIFPSFLFIVGVAIPLSFALPTAIRRRVLRRSAILFLLGLAVNGFPDYGWSTLRLPGILQRIALCYLIGGLLYASFSRTPRISERDTMQRATALFAGTAFAMLAVYWALLKWVPVPGFGSGHLDSLRNLPAFLDRMLIGTRHMWPWGLTEHMGVTYDPEGILSTLPACSATLLGILAGEWMGTQHSGKRKAVVLALVGLVLLCAGWFLSPLLPLNKRIWTSTFALFSSGMSLLAFSVLYALIDLRRSRWWTPLALVFGTNAILAFVLSGVLTTLSDRLHAPGSGDPAASLHAWAYLHLFATWLSPINASLVYAIALVLLNALLVLPLYRRRVFLRI